MTLNFLLYNATNNEKIRKTKAVSPKTPPFKKSSQSPLKKASQKLSFSPPAIAKHIAHKNKSDSEATVVSRIPKMKIVRMTKKNRVTVIL